jgi:hypothetical protein
MLAIARYYGSIQDQVGGEDPQGSRAVARGTAAHAAAVEAADDGQQEPGRREADILVAAPKVLRLPHEAVEDVPERDVALGGILARPQGRRVCPLLGGG